MDPLALYQLDPAAARLRVGTAFMHRGVFPFHYILWLKA